MRREGGGGKGEGGKERLVSIGISDRDTRVVAPGIKRWWVSASCLGGWLNASFAKLDRADN